LAWPENTCPAPLLQSRSFPPSSNAGCSNCPVEMVTWQEASDYCTAIGRHLPTEAQWEYASRNGGTAPVNAYATGSATAPVACTDANYNNCLGSTIAVGSYAPSASGLYDMAGNVWEWVSDWYDANYYANGQVDPQGPGTGTNRVMRGGSLVRSPSYLRASSRFWNVPATRFADVGFRCAQ